MADLQRKQAIKRLMQDLQEIDNSPVENVSAQPMDDNMLEWHCNFQLEGTVFHLILFFPNNYPYVSPSAEFVPTGYRFSGGATDGGKKGVKVCLSIFSDFAKYHREWANEKGMGWSPGYTVQTVLLNLVSFLSESMGDSNFTASFAHSAFEYNTKLAKDYKCEDCGHTHDKPYPPLYVKDETKGKGKGKIKKSSKIVDPDEIQLVDYISKVKFDGSKKLKGKDDLFGYGLIVTGANWRPSLTTPCEMLTSDSFYGMKKSIGKVHSMMKEEIKYFLPMYINKNHGSGIKEQFESTMKELTNLLKDCKGLSVPEMVLKTIPNLMSATVVEFSKGSQHTSDNALNGYFALHRLLLWAVETYPEIQAMVDDRLEAFIDDDLMRRKDKCLHFGECLMLLNASSKFRWEDAADAFIKEAWRRNVMWYVKEDGKLGDLETSLEYRLPKTMLGTRNSRKMLPFQVTFMDLAMPKNMTRKQIIERYDNNQGFPTSAMVKEMKEAVKDINGMGFLADSYNDWFKALKLEPPSKEEIFDRLVESVKFSINTKGYHWSGKNGGGWDEVHKKYPNGTGDADECKSGDEPSSKDKETGAKSDGKGKGKRQAPAKRGRGGKKAKVEVDSDDQEADDDDHDEKIEDNKKGKGKRQAPPNRGRGGKKAKVEDDEKVTSNRGGGAKGTGNRGRGRGRGKRGRAK